MLGLRVACAIEKLRIDPERGDYVCDGRGV